MSGFNPKEIFEKHPTPWNFDADGITDANEEWVIWLGCGDLYGEGAGIAETSTLDYITSTMNWIYLNHLNQERKDD